MGTPDKLRRLSRRRAIKRNYANQAAFRMASYRQPPVKVARILVSHPNPVKHCHRPEEASGPRAKPRGRRRLFRAKTRASDGPAGSVAQEPAHAGGTDRQKKRGRTDRPPLSPLL